MARTGIGACVLVAGGLAMTLLVGAAAAGPLVKWRAPDGSLWFGDDPPPGSVRLGEIEPVAPAREAPPPDEAEAADAAAARDGRDVIRRRAEKRAEERARREVLRHAVEISTQSVTRGNLGWIIVGSVRNTAADPVHDVRVGAGGVWTSTDPVRIPPGGEGTFRLEVPSYPYTEYDAVPPVEIDWKERRS